MNGNCGKTQMLHSAWGASVTLAISVTQEYRAVRCGCGDSKRRISHQCNKSRSLHSARRLQVSLSPGRRQAHCAAWVSQRNGTELGSYRQGGNPEHAFWTRLLTPVSWLKSITAQKDYICKLFCCCFCSDTPQS